MAGEGEPRTVWRQPTGDAGPGAARTLASSHERRRDERRSDQKPILPPGGGLPPNGRSLLFWLAASFLLLWVWQEAFQYLAYRTLPYSEFKRYLAAGEISEVAIKNGMRTLKDYSLWLLQNGWTTMDEVLQVVSVQE